MNISGHFDNTKVEHVFLTQNVYAQISNNLFSRNTLILCTRIEEIAQNRILLLTY